jgi:hypothetical protein
VQALEGASPVSVALADAARELGIEVSALRCWIRRTGIELVSDPADTRRRLLRSEDFARLRRERGTFAVTVEAAQGGAIAWGPADLRDELERVRDAASQHSGVLNEQLAVLFMQLAELATRVTQLEEHPRRP